MRRVPCSRPVAFALRYGCALGVFFFATVSYAWIQQQQQQQQLPTSDRVRSSRYRYRYRYRYGSGSSTHFSSVAVDFEKDPKIKKRSEIEREPKANELSTAAFSSDSSWEELGRALELLGITWDEWLSPLGQGLLPPDNENPSSWDDFWELSLKDRHKNDGDRSHSHSYSYSHNDNSILVAEQFTRYLERMGATYVKFGQALSARPDIVPRSLAVALSKLQDDMDVLDETTTTASTSTKHASSVRLATADGARSVLRNEYTSSSSLPFKDHDQLEEFLSSLSEAPVAAASIGVVYSGILPDNGGKVAIKIQRPGVRETVRKDAKLLRRVAEVIESIPSFRKDESSPNESTTTTKNRWIQTNLTGAVDEFMTRLEEELDYGREADNLELFGKLYSHKRTASMEDRVGELVNMNVNVNLPSDTDINVVVPEVYRDLCTDRVLVMEWIDGIKLVDLRATSEQPPMDGEEERRKEETMELIRQGIDCTLSQLLETGILHADPHGGNLLKVPQNNNENMLGYIDFGMLSTIPSTVQDGLICAVCQLIFANNVTAVSELFGELQLLPEHILEDPIESAALAEELTLCIGKVLVFPTDEENRPKIPTLRFDELLDVLTRLVPRFQFQLPPYFLNNARALATLEGMAREVDPSFNILRHLYPYAISRIFSNPTGSPVVESTLQSLIKNPSTGTISVAKVLKLVKDASNYSGYSKRKVVADVAKSNSGPRLVVRLMREQTIGRIRRRSRQKIKRKKRGSKRRQLLGKLVECSRL